MNSISLKRAKLEAFVTATYNLWTYLVGWTLFILVLNLIICPDSQVMIIENILLWGSVTVPILITSIPLYGLAATFVENIIAVLSSEDLALELKLGGTFLFVFTVFYFIAALVYRELVYEPTLDFFNIEYIPGPEFW